MIASEYVGKRGMVVIEIGIGTGAGTTATGIGITTADDGMIATETVATVGMTAGTTAERTETTGATATCAILTAATLLPELHPHPPQRVLAVSSKSSPTTAWEGRVRTTIPISSCEV